MKYIYILFIFMLLSPSVRSQCRKQDLLVEVHGAFWFAKTKYNDNSDYRNNTLSYEFMIGRLLRKNIALGVSQKTRIDFPYSDMYKNGFGIYNGHNLGAGPFIRWYIYNWKSEKRGLWIEAGVNYFQFSGRYIEPRLGDFFNELGRNETFKIGWSKWITPKISINLLYRFQHFTYFDSSKHPWWDNGFKVSANFLIRD